ncbi:MAG: hypothetical protein P8Z00_20190, partial [Anaerolineales bacterium]
MQSYPLSRRARLSPIIYVFIFGLITALLILPILGNLPSPAGSSSGNAPAVASTLSQLPLAFIPTGENHSTAEFTVYGAGNNLTFSPEAITLNRSGSAQPLRLSFVDANQAPLLEASETLPTRINDYRGQEAANWQTNVPAYAGITYQELYPGISLHYKGTDGTLKSTFSLAPGTDPTRIRWHYAGASAVAMDQASGDLLVTLPDQSQVVERAPIAWQEINGQRIPVQAAYALLADQNIAFSLGSYDASAPLIIDPTIVYASTHNLGYLDSGLDIVSDSAGNAYVLGRVYDTNNDVLIAKLAPDGSLDYATYLRGSALDFGGGITLDASDDIYVAG